MHGLNLTLDLRVLLLLPCDRKREKIQALSLAKECYSMKLDLLTNATVVDDAIRFVSNKLKDESIQDNEIQDTTGTTKTTNEVF